MGKKLIPFIFFKSEFAVIVFDILDESESPYLKRKYFHGIKFFWE